MPFERQDPVPGSEVRILAIALTVLLICVLPIALAALVMVLCVFPERIGQVALVQADLGWALAVTVPVLALTGAGFLVLVSRLASNEPDGGER